MAFLISVSSPRMQAEFARAYATDKVCTPLAIDNITMAVQELNRQFSPSAFSQRMGPREVVLAYLDTIHRRERPYGLS